MSEDIHFDTHQYLWMCNRIYINAQKTVLINATASTVKYKHGVRSHAEIVVNVNPGT